MSEQQDDFVRQNETRPLLSGHETAIQSPAINGGNPNTSSESFPVPDQRNTLLLCIALALILDVGGVLLDVPDVKLLEMAVCRDYYRVHNPNLIGPPPLSYVDEKHCKIGQIQADLATLRYRNSMLGRLPGLLFGVFYGQLADQLGRKRILVLGFIGVFLSCIWVILVCYFHEKLPTNWILASAAFTVIGGGPHVFTATIHMIIADVTSKETRTTAFYWLSVSILSAQAIAIPVGSWLLNQDLWLPYKFSVPILFMGLPVILAIPETSPNNNTECHPDCVPIREQAHFAPRASSFVQKQVILQFAFSTLLIVDKLQQLLITLNFLLQLPKMKNRSLSISFTIMLALSFSNQSRSIFIQFASKRLGYPIYKTGYVESVGTFVSWLVLLLLALTTRIFGMQYGRLLSRDLRVVIYSPALLFLGSALLGSATNLAMIVLGTIITAAGRGVFPAMLGIMASSVNSSHVGRLYTSVAICTQLSSLTGKFVFGAIFATVVKSSSNWKIGIPYFVSAFGYLGASLSAGFMLTSDTISRAMAS